MNDIKVSFPLKGIWQVVTSPADHVPSHYTDMLGMSHAFDFAKTEDLNRSFIKKVKTTDTQRTVGWRQDVLAPCNGKIVRMVSSQKDRQKLHYFKDLLSGIKAFTFKKTRTDYHTVFGNYLIIESNGYYCLLAHLKQNSMRFAVGEEVKVGDKLAEIGHCGSSKIPHLHFQIMDSDNLSVAKGLPVYFDLRCEVNRQWNTIEYCLPTIGAKIQGLTHK